MIKKTSSEEYKMLENLEAFCFPLEKWNLDQILSHHQYQNSLLYFSENNPKAVGYLLYLENTFEIEILRIGVLDNYRRTGIAGELIDFLITIAPGRDIFLEVKSENIPAIELYKKKGFINLGVRKRYYPDGKDAILLKRENK